MIEGVRIARLKVIPDERGRLMELFRDDDETFERFGQAYMTSTLPGVVKAWHYHREQTDNMACVHGMVKVVLCDWRPESPSYRQVLELFIGEHNPVRVRIPPLVLHGWKCTSPYEALVVNLPSRHYDYEQPDELRLPWDSPEVGYDWGVKFR